VTNAHAYETMLHWADTNGTANYRSYSRNFEVFAAGKPVLAGSSDSAFRGDATRYNPEDLLVASLSSCHLLWYLHLCAVDGIAVLDYRDHAVGTMQLNDDGSGRFVRVELRPLVTMAAGGDAEKARALHERAHHLCYIARSVNFPVECTPEILIEKVA
jgi:organic hydroperoxide reductase OsmC/OhrA